MALRKIHYTGPPHLVSDLTALIMAEALPITQTQSAPPGDDPDGPVTVAIEVQGTPEHFEDAWARLSVRWIARGFAHHGTIENTDA